MTDLSPSHTAYKLWLSEVCRCGDSRRDHMRDGKACLVHGCGCVRFTLPSAEIVRPVPAPRPTFGSRVIAFVDRHPEALIFSIALGIAAVAMTAVLLPMWLEGSL